MWFSDLCGLVRLPPGGSPRRGGQAARVCARASWCPTRRAACGSPPTVEPGGGHVAADGPASTLLKSKDPSGTQDVAVAPDGSAWFAGGKLHARARQRGRDAHPATDGDPGVVRRVRPRRRAVARAASRALQHTTLDAPAGRATTRRRRARIVPDPSKPVSLATLRRQGGFKITVREPFAIEGYVFDSDADETIAGVLRA